MRRGGELLELKKNKMKNEGSSPSKWEVQYPEFFPPLQTCQSKVTQCKNI